MAGDLLARRMTNRITVKQVAEAAAVSTQTVSRVVNNAAGVLPETRQKVLEAIEKLGYRPNAIARSLTQRRSCTIGVVASEIEQYGPSRTLVGIEKKANGFGYSLSLSLHHQPESEDVWKFLDSFLSRQVDGIIWASHEIGNSLKWLEREHLPVPVVFMESQPRPGVITVNINSRLGGELAVRHFLSEGYRRIGIITGPLQWWSARERLHGWRQALVEANCPAEERQVVEADWSTGSGAEGLERLLQQFPEVEAIFVCNDQMALGVLQASRRLGKRVPEDLAIIGFDDIPEAAYFWPSLTTVRQDLMKFGGTAVQLLSQMITARQEEGPHPAFPESVWLNPELVIRNSSVHNRLFRQPERRAIETPDLDRIIR
jgi:LacI family transcriptional regulator